MKREKSEKRPSEPAWVQMEERFHAIVDTIEDGYFEVDLAGNMIFCNKANALLFNYHSPEELMGMNYKEYTDPENAQKVFEVYHKVYQTGLPHKGFHWVIKDKEGEKVYVDTSVSLILNPEQKKIGFRGILRDITKEKRAEAALRESEERYRNILESIQEGYYETDLKGNYVFYNQAFCNILGVTKEDLKGISYREFVDSENFSKIYDVFNEVYRSGEPATAYGWEATRRDGSKRYLEVSISLQIDMNGNITGFKGIARDVSERKWTELALKESEAKYRTLFEAAQSAIFLIRGDQIIDCNSHTLKVFGGVREQIIGRTTFDFSPSKQPDGRGSRDKAREKFNEALRGEPQLFEWKHHRLDGSLFDAEVSLNRTEIGGTFFVQAIVRDITDKKQAEEALKAMSLVDDLTGLYNRRGFLTLAGQEIKTVNRMKNQTCLIFVDLDGMKIINDTFGHLEGDKALVSTSRILKECFRDQDILARIGGDEFVILAKEGASKTKPEMFMERVRKHLRQYNEKVKFPYAISLSMGAVTYDPDHPVSIEALLAQADTLMYQEKQRKKAINAMPR